MALGHDVSAELRGPHGEWTRTGAALKKMAGEAKATNSTEGKIAAIPEGTTKRINGVAVHHVSDTRVRVGFKKAGGGWEYQHYGSRADAAKAVDSGHHVSTASPGSEKAVREVARAPAPKVPARAPAAPTASTEARTITATGLKPGMVVSSGHWQAPKGQHEVAKVEKSGAATRSGGVTHAQGIYNTASTHITDSNGRHYQVSNNTKFKVHKESPAAPDIAARRSAQAAEQGRLADIQARQEFARVESKGTPPAGMTPELQAQLRTIQAAEKARVEADNKARHPGGSVTEYKDMLNKPSLAGGAAPPVSITRYKGVLITSMSDRQLQAAARKPGSPSAIKDEIARRERVAAQSSARGVPEGMPPPMRAMHYQKANPIRKNIPAPKGARMTASERTALSNILAVPESDITPATVERYRAQAKAKQSNLRLNKPSLAGGAAPPKSRTAKYYQGLSTHKLRLDGSPGALAELKKRGESARKYNMPQSKAETEALMRSMLR